ncbi:Glycine-rich RNA-binding protein RZ1B, partial [Cucurbita argyrosperma subsp. argyrosperma]
MFVGGLSLNISEISLRMLSAGSAKFLKLREMHGHEFSERIISVNKAEPKMEGDDAEPCLRGGGYSSGGRASFGRGGDRSVGQDECFNLEVQGIGHETVLQLVVNLGGVEVHFRHVSI